MTRRRDTPAHDAPATGPAPPGRGVFCNRTLNLRSIGAIGYDMDYTLVHYHARAWEERAYARLRSNLRALGWPVEDLAFDPALVVRGLVVDLHTGNIVKANRFGYVKRAMHGTRMLDFDEQRRAYARTRVDLSDERWVFLNTLFSLSEGCMYAQLVERLDERALPGTMGYGDLYARVRASLDEEHMRGELKAEIMAAPERFVALDPEVPIALLDQKLAGKKLLLITNSEWSYTRFMMSYAFDRFLPAKMGWLGLFDLVIVSAGKPDFFSTRMPAFEVVSDEGAGRRSVRGRSRRAELHGGSAPPDTLLVRPVGHTLGDDGAFYGGNAALVERHLGLSGEEILYVGDHPFGDVHVSKSALRWRTGLILRELEEEITAQLEFEPRRLDLVRIMAEKERLELRQSQLRLAAQRVAHAYALPPQPMKRDEIDSQLSRLRASIGELDDRAAPLAQQSSELANTRWGLLLRTGNDKSLLARQIERYADIYLSRVSNFLYVTPFAFLRSARGSLPHDPEPLLPEVVAPRDDS